MLGRRPAAVIKFALATTSLTILPLQVLATEASEVFKLGEIVVTGKSAGKTTGKTDVGGTSISADEMRNFARDTLDDALNLVPGAGSSNTGGSRNERVINVRGFDRWQVPLYMDGVRVFLPADNRIDFGRFLTPDLSEIQVSKGYVSVLNGPDGMGGAINLVTRKPTKAAEAELRNTLLFDNRGALSGSSRYASAGTRQEKYYLQAGATRNEKTHTALPFSYNATANENGGNRDQSDRRDWRLAMKAGYTPNADDEYSLNFVKQSGKKSAPLHITDPVASQRYWQWPYWDLTSLYWLSDTKLGEASYIKSKLYYNTFSNGLFSYDNAQYSRQSLAKSFRSYYDDAAYGGSLEAGTDLIPHNTLKAALHYRRDDHTERQTIYSPTRFDEPKQKAIEDTWSAAVENTFHATDRFDLAAGVSYDRRLLHKAQDWQGTNTGSFVNYKTTDADAWNLQTAAIYRYSDTGKAHASVSSRTRFPTIFERFSSRFGGATSNPDLQPEHAVNYEIGFSDQLGKLTRIEAAAFVSKLDDVIQSVPTTYQGTAVTQSRNVGSGVYKGFEIAVNSQVLPDLELGGNYTLLKRDIDAPAAPNLKPTGTPDHKLFLYANYTPLEGLTVTPSVEAATDRFTTNTAGTVYYGTGAYVLSNLQVSYQFTERLEAAAGVRNIFDRSYTLVDGFPEEGRSFHLTGRLVF
jgi:iron complex outermembrane recepter protein